MGTAIHGCWLGQIALHSGRQVILLSCSRQSGLHSQNSCSRQSDLHGQSSCSRQSGLHGQNSPAQRMPTSTVRTLPLKAGRPPRSHISPALCSPPDCQLCRPNSLKDQPHYYMCISRGYTCALVARPFLLFLIGEDEINMWNVYASHAGIRVCVS